MLSDFVDLQLLVIGIPSVTQFHESLYNRAFAEGSSDEKKKNEKKK